MASAQSAHAGVSEQSAGRSSGASQAQSSSVSTTKQPSSSQAAIFTGVASSVQPAVGFLAAIIGVMALV